MKLSSMHQIYFALFCILLPHIFFMHSNAGFVAGTSIYTEQCMVPIEKIVVGQGIVSFDGNQNLFDCRVTHVYKKPTS